MCVFRDSRERTCACFGLKGLSNPEGHLIAYRGLSRKNTRTEKLPILSMSGLARVEQAPSRGPIEF